MHVRGEPVMAQPATTNRRSVRGDSSPIRGIKGEEYIMGRRARRAGHTAIISEATVLLNLVPVL
jgi:hypothetical protein